MESLCVATGQGRERKREWKHYLVYFSHRYCPLAQSIIPTYANTSTSLFPWYSGSPNTSLTKCVFVSACVQMHLLGLSLVVWILCVQETAVPEKTPTSPPLSLYSSLQPSIHALLPFIPHSLFLAPYSTSLPADIPLSAFLPSFFFPAPSLSAFFFSSSPIPSFCNCIFSFHGHLK